MRSRAGTAGIQAQETPLAGLNHMIQNDSASDASVKRETFLSTRALEAKGFLDPW